MSSIQNPSDLALLSEMEKLMETAENTLDQSKIEN